MKVISEVKFQENVSSRWASDMGSDVKLAKMIRPLTLICLMGMFMLTMVFDSVDTLPFNVKDSYVDLLQILMLTAFGAYFAGRTIEKKSNNYNLELLHQGLQIESIFSLGYLLFSICLLIYVCIIFLGPKIGPGFIFNEEELMLQVVAQKIIVALFTLAMLSQVMAFKKV